MDTPRDEAFMESKDPYISTAAVSIRTFAMLQ
jgi:hypothetical protein